MQRDISSLLTIPKKTIYCIEGNISSGKTTVIKNLLTLGYSVFEEPLEVWQTRYVNEEGKNILQLFYEDAKRWGFAFEVIIMTTRYNQLINALYSPSQIVFIERSLITDPKVFAKNLYETKNMTEMEWIIYQDWHATFMEIIHLVSNHNFEYIYIQTPPDVCFERKVGRARTEEDDVTPTYFHELHAHHENWLTDNKYPVHIIDGSKTKEEVLDQIKQILPL